MNRIFCRLMCALAVVAVAAAFWSCSPKKNTAATRNYQAFITRYNIYFNGDEHYKETLKEMERAYEDDYTTTLFMHPAEARANPKAPQPSGSFTRSIEKAQKAIQLRSIKKRPRRKPGKGNDPEYKKWLKRDEYNPFLHNAWMMMGRSQYMDGDFLGAASTFYYTARHFSWLPATVLEAQLWQARSYCALDWLFEAETILKRVKTDQLTSRRLKKLYYFTYADFYVRSHDNTRAIGMLTEAIPYAKGAQKTRLTFLLGQLKAVSGDKKGAYEAFKKAAGASSAPYRTRFNARIKQSEVFDGANIESEVKSLKRMARYGANKEYLDQIYYAIGNLYLSRRDTTNAIANYVLAAEKSTRNGIDKAISQVPLGGVYFARG
ncbi:MAG: tetratricopeptide repeat protein, partial [Duncaniella sp.]|nr:tetratricopeptide repeat protein [Duncaniella sp.]